MAAAASQTMAEGRGLGPEARQRYEQRLTFVESVLIKRQLFKTQQRGIPQLAQSRVGFRNTLPAANKMKPRDILAHWGKARLLPLQSPHPQEFPYYSGRV